MTEAVVWLRGRGVTEPIRQGKSSRYIVSSRPACATLLSTFHMHIHTGACVSTYIYITCVHTEIQKPFWIC